MPDGPVPAFLGERWCALTSQGNRGQERALDAIGGPRSNNEDEIPHTKTGGAGCRAADERPGSAITRQRQNSFELRAG